MIFFESGGNLAFRTLVLSEFCLASFLTWEKIAVDLKNAEVFFQKLQRDKYIQKETYFPLLWCCFFRLTLRNLVQYLSPSPIHDWLYANNSLQLISLDNHLVFTLCNVGKKEHTQYPHTHEIGVIKTKQLNFFSVGWKQTYVRWVGREWCGEGEGFYVD